MPLSSGFDGIQFKNMKFSKGCLSGQPQGWRSPFLAVVLAVCLLLQSCSIYRKTPISLEEAATSGTPVKIRRQDGRPLRFMVVEQRGDRYFGIPNSPKKSQMPIDTVGISGVYPKNIKASRRVTTAVGVLAAGGIAFGFMVAMLSQIGESVLEEGQQ